MYIVAQKGPVMMEQGIESKTLKMTQRRRRNIRVSCYAIMCHVYYTYTVLRLDYDVRNGRACCTESLLGLTFFRS
jgi:hypothetical protein